VVVMGPSVGSVTHNEKFTLPSPLVSYRLHASSVLLPETLISSQFHDTLRDAGRPASSTHSRVRSFWPGSSLGPAVSLTHVSAASATLGVSGLLPPKADTHSVRSNPVTSKFLTTLGRLDQVRCISIASSFSDPRPFLTLLDTWLDLIANYARKYRDALGNS
jgi:hypothetical protein